MTELSASEKKAPGKLTGYHVLMMLLSAFAVILVVNGIFIYKAVTTRNPRDAVGAYDRGLRYNEQLEADRKQAELGWNHETQIVEGHTIRVNFVDRTGAPVTGLNITGWLGLPASDRSDFPIAFSEAQPGVYTAQTELKAGAWLATLTATKSGAGDDKITYSIKDLLRWQVPADVQRKH